MECLLLHGLNELLEKLRTVQHQRRGQMKSILDPSFRYTNSVETDLRKTFAKARRELRKQLQARGVSEESLKVLPGAPSCLSDALSLGPP